MSRRIKAALGDKDKEPKDFPTAFERTILIGQIQPLTDDVTAAADDNTRAQKKAALEAHLMEVGRLLQLALDLRDSDSDLKAVAQARYLQSFVMLKLGRPLDSLILAKHCMISDRTNDPDTALNATEIAMAAAVSAWNMAPSNDRDFETRALKDVCQTILKFYPQSSWWRGQDTIGDSLSHDERTSGSCKMVSGSTGDGPSICICTNQALVDPTGLHGLRNPPSRQKIRRTIRRNPPTCRHGRQKQRIC